MKAEGKPTTGQEDVRVTMERKSWGTIFTGRQADLIALGICNEHHFPQGRKRTLYDRGRYTDDCHEYVNGDEHTPGSWHTKRLAGGICTFHARRLERGYWPDVWEQGGGAVDISPLVMRKAAEARLKEWAAAAVGMGYALADAYLASPARYIVGDKAMCCRDDEDAGSEVEVVKPYNSYKVEGHGEQRLLGYVVCYVGDKDRTFYVPAHRLLEADYSVRHLRLVETRPRA